jgi:hypothetical protein
MSRHDSSCPGVGGTHVGARVRDAAPSALERQQEAAQVAGRRSSRLVRAPEVHLTQHQRHPRATRW